MNRYNRGEVKEERLSTNLSVAVVAHTHSARMASETVGARTYYLMDCGSWVNGGHEIGLLSGNDVAICQWG